MDTHALPNNWRLQSWGDVSLITVVGSINLDLTADVGRLPHPGETVMGDAFRTAPGGKGANQALAAQRAGSQVRMIGAVGRDAFAKDALALLKSGGVDLTSVAQTGQATGVAVILVSDAGENVIAVVPGANALVGADALEDVFAGSNVALFQLEIPLPTVAAALNQARAAGCISVLNTAPFRSDAAPFIGLADYLVANETEFDLYATELGLTGHSREERMNNYAQKTRRTVIVTLGADGVIAVGPHGHVKVAALPIKPVDTVGAGDTFCGYLGDGLARGLPLEQALKRAAAAGSLACLKPGAQPAIPLAADVEAAIR